MKAQSKLNKKANNKKNLLKEEGNIRIEALYNIILTESGKPDYLAIDIYTEARSWYKPKKTNIQGNIVYSSKLSGYGWQIGYEYLANKHKCTTELIRRKLVLLEKLGLLTRDFRTEYYHGKRFNNNMYLLVWKDTPHFYSEIGLEKKVVTTPQNQVELCKNSCPPLQQKLDNIYVIPNNGKKKEEEAKAYSSSFFSSTPIEVDTPLACAREGKIQPCKIVQISNTKPEPAPQEPIIEVPTLAISSLAELAKVYQAEEIRVVASKVVNCDQLEEQPYEKIVQLKSRILVEETASISSEEGSVNTGRIDQITQLKAEIFKVFDSKTSEEIMENCTFTELEPNKLGISIRAKFIFSEHDKQMLKTCVHMTYGSEIKMVNTSATEKPTPIEEVSKVMQARSNCLKWDRFKNELLKYFPDKTGDHILNAWFDKLRVSEDVPNNRIILTGSTFYVDSVYSRFETAIESVVKKQKVTLELHYENNNQRPIIYKPNGGF
ncbi:hypothetical protein [Candidatus Bandiella numerosa]|uniref:hypothetical protein n=1 Tax=Candidatus Bandiella numerosa TaxID=2570586 RepID=UPI001F386800|nr:hypothetical protein [Candidatus Bandiella numerosa]